MGVSKKERTTVERDRITALKDRLDAAIAEHHRMRDELNALERRHPLEAPRDALRRELRRMRRKSRVGG